MKFFKFLTVFLLFITISCKKKELNFSFKGTITSTYNNAPLANAKVTIKGKSLGSSMNNKSESTKTNSSGEFEITLERSKIEHVEIVIEKENFFTETRIIYFDNLLSAEDNIVNFDINAKSWTRFDISNINSPDSEDVFRFLKTGGKSDCEECCDNGKNIYLYGDFDTTFYCINNGGSYMRFYHWFNDNEIHGLDSIHNTPFDTVSYTLSY